MVRTDCLWILRSLIICVLFFTFQEISFAQTPHNITIAGKVVDERTGEVLSGATVHIRNTTHEVVTDEQGEFHFLTGQELPVTLEITYTGYRPHEVLVKTNGAIISLHALDKQLNELTVVGYTRTKSNARTGAITTVAAADVSKVNYTSITEKLQGQVPGLSISSNSGVPGTSVLVRLRGATSITAGNDPLYVVDGIFMNTDNLQNLGRGLGGQVPNFLSDLNPDDIESISVLKDANASAVYGARGANGVILITTRRGTKNARSRVNFNAQYGRSKSTNLWKLVTGPEHAAIVNAASTNDGVSANLLPFRPKDQVVAGYPAYGTAEEQPTVDRISKVFRTAVTQQYNLSVTGGDAKTNFFLGGNFESDQSTLKLEDFRRYSLRFNLDHSLLSNLKIGTSNSLSYVPRREVRVGDGPAGLFQAALHTPTFYPLYNPDGSYYKVGVFDNVLAILGNSNTHSYSLRALNSIYASLTLFQGLTFKSTFSNDYANYHEKAYYNTKLVYGQPAGEANDVLSTRETLIAEQLLNFNRNFHDRSDLSVFVGNTVQYSTYETESITGTGFPSDQFQRIASAAVQTGSSSGSKSRLVSFFSGINYSLDNKYSVDANIRADASSRFGVDHRWGYFPSVGLGWNISKERFFPKTDLVNDLRLKSSYGLTGNQNISDFASRGLWNGGNNYIDQPGIAPNQPSNPNLKWETTRQFNAGIQGSLIHRRLNIEFNYYDKYTFDLLLPAPLPVVSGFPSIVSNVGAMSNKGVELLLTSTNIESRNFSWRTTFTISHNHNNVVKLLTPITDGSYGMYQIQQGHPLYSIYVFHELGVDPKTGNVIDEDASGPNGKPDGKITNDDKKIVGDIWPKLEGVLKNTFGYKGFSLDANLVYKSGNKVFNYTRMFLESGGTRGVTRSILKSALDYWKKPGDVNVLPRPTSVANADGSSNYNGSTSRFFEDASYVRLRDITLAYDLPLGVVTRLHISNARIFATASNLFTITRYTGPDPEANNSGDSGSIVQGLDFNTTPQPKTIVVGIHLIF